ncbi:MAG: hypothetical protein R2736_02130 [Solirubrobacterales bacterium]
MTARTPYGPGGANVSATLSDLERKLRRLEAELTAGAPDTAPAPPFETSPAPPFETSPAPPVEAEPAPPLRTPPAPPFETTPAPPTDVTPPRPATGMGDADRLLAEARARLGGLTGQVDELLRFREQLQRTARELEAEYSRVLERIGAPAAPSVLAAAPPLAAAPAPPPTAPAVTPPPPEQPAVPGMGTAPVDGAPATAPPPASSLPPAAPTTARPPTPAPAAATSPFPPAASTTAPPPTPAPAAATGPLPPTVPSPISAPETAAAPPGAGGHDDLVFEGPVVVDAGPFTDIAALSAFEQRLARVPGVEDVYVSGFEGNRALIELRVVTPVALVREIRADQGGGFEVAEAAAGRLRIDLRPAATGG